jgi:patatin-related protein
MANGTSHGHAHEVRLGLVMYGGVSLAVYINGVANELFRAVRGRGVYRVLKELTDSDVAVDVVSGTSAGGINGILLGYALANSREFAPSTEIWREGADIGALLRKPYDGVASSLLDSENVYQPRLEQVLERMWATPIDSPNDDATFVRELDLFVTGTDYNGRLGTTLDEAGHSIDVKDHRALFWLKHRAGRKQQFHPEADAAGRLPPPGDERARHAGIVALATLARITSCFPAAFTPVVIPRRGDPPSRADEKLRMWGRLDDDQDYCFLDGGVLDNKPFTSTLRTIFYRTAERPVRRHVLYVEPDPERFDGAERPEFRIPSFTQSALDSLTKLPGYESIADDLKLVAEHNDKIERLARLRAAVAETGSPPSDAQRSLWRKARLFALRDFVLRRMLGVESGERLADELAERARALGDAFDRRYLENVEESEYLLADFDVEFRLRRLFHLTYSETNPATLLAINREIEFLEIARHAMEEALFRGTEARERTAPEEVWKRAFRRLTALLRLDADARPFPRSRPENDPTVPLSSVELESARVEFNRRLAALTTDAAPEGNNVFVVSDRYELAVAHAYGAVTEKEYTAYEALDAWLYPLEFVADLHERDVIRVTRLSPLDAKRGLSGRDLREKLCGDTLAHFGAFFKRSWRSNDILWGRLDGVCQLVETLLSRDWLSTTLPVAARRRLFDCDRTTTRADRPARVLSWLERHDVFPHAGQALRTTIAGELAHLLDTVFAEGALETESRVALERRLETAWEPLVNDLVRAAQLDILHGELPKVVEDAAFEQMQWNQLATKSRAGGTDDVHFDASTLTWSSNRGSFDPLLLALCSRELATKALDALRSSDDPAALEEYFRAYRVGSETVTEDVPRVVLLELGGRAALVAENCLVESFPRPEDVRGHWLFRLCIDWPLRVFDATARFLRQAPGARKPLVVGSIAYVALAIVVNTLWLETLYAEDGVSRQIALALFFAGPIASGTFAWLLVRPFRSRRPAGTGVRRLLRLATIALAVVATAWLLDADRSPLCEEAPFASFGAHCSAAIRYAILLFPVTVGTFLGIFDGGSVRRKRRKRRA